MDKHIQWFPGHIAKGRNDILDIVKNVDLLVEILDCRALYSSKQDDYLKDVINRKPLLYVLNKTDLTDPEDLKNWEKLLKENNINYCLFSSKDNASPNLLLKAIKNESFKIRKKYENKGIKNKIIRCIIFGVPNIGKSTIINRLLHRKQLVAKNIPGVTRKINEVKLDDYTRLFDTAGILPTKIEDQIIAKKLCLINTISSKNLSYVELGKFLSDYIQKDYIKCLKDYCNKSNISSEKEIYQAIKEKRNILLKQPENYEEISEIFVRDFQNGNVGKISLEKCNKTLISSFIKNTNI